MGGIIVYDKTGVDNAPLLRSERRVDRESAVMTWLSQHSLEGESVPSVRAIVTACEVSATTAARVRRRFLLNFEKPPRAYSIYAKKTLDSKCDPSRSRPTAAQLKAAHHAEFTLIKLSDTIKLITLVCPTDDPVALLLLDADWKDLVQSFVDSLCHRLRVPTESASRQFIASQELQVCGKWHAHLFIDVERSLTEDFIQSHVKQLWRRMLQQLGHEEGFDFFVSKAGSNLTHRAWCHVESFRFANQHICDTGYLSHPSKFTSQATSRMIQTEQGWRRFHLDKSFIISSALKRAINQKFKTFHLSLTAAKAFRDLAEGEGVEFDDSREAGGWALPSQGRVTDEDLQANLTAFLEEFDDPDAATWRTVTIASTGFVTVSKRIYHSKKKQRLARIGQRLDSDAIAIDWLHRRLKDASRAIPGEMPPPLTNADMPKWNKAIRILKRRLAEASHFNLPSPLLDSS